MPSSYVDSVPPIIHTLIALKPRSIIDIGPGWGKYGLMCREYLDLERLWAIEVEPGRLPTQDTIYDHVITGDARTFSRRGWPWTSTDIALLIDVIEHMTAGEGHRLLNAITNSGARALVSTPKTFFEQHDDHNPYETHVSFWNWPRFRKQHVIERDISTIDAIIYLLGATT